MAERRDVIMKRRRRDEWISEPKLDALVYLVIPSQYTPITSTSIHFSILPSFLSRLPPTVQALRITFWFSFDDTCDPVGSLSSFSLDCLWYSPENAVDTDGVASLYITLDTFVLTATFENPAPDYDATDCFTRTFTLLSGDCSQTIFAPIGEHDSSVHMIDDTSSSVSSPDPNVTIIQLAFPLGSGVCFISRLPDELLSFIFECVSSSEVDVTEEEIENFGSSTTSRLFAVCHRWNAVSAGHYEPDSAEEKHARLKINPNAGRLWKSLWFERKVSSDMAKELIAGSPNVAEIVLLAFGNEEEVNVVLTALEGLTRAEKITFKFMEGWRSWRRDEVEHFMRRMEGAVRHLEALDVEDAFSTFSASGSLHLPHGFKSLRLDTYPPLTSLALPDTLRRLTLARMCPLPPCISGSALPPRLEYLSLALFPYSPNGTPSVLRAPLELSHLRHLKDLYLDGGDETSNLLPRQFFGTLSNAVAIELIDIEYCAVDWFGFPEFIGWFFGRVKKVSDGSEEEEKLTGYGLSVRLSVWVGNWTNYQGFGNLGTVDVDMMTCGHFSPKKDTARMPNFRIPSTLCLPRDCREWTREGTELASTCNPLELDLLG
ncbi:hypothetical protein BT69DRAFT_1277916 [Atractiella rhizophila]|nr:hypothetical protein BT69DRAFT_1277916 [Atractiella rhizophila]